MNKPSPLEPEERETIICFNAKDKEASIFTYDKRWQTHLEQKLKLTALFTGSRGGKEYEIDKKRIPLPRVPMKLSAKARAERGKRLLEARQR